ncbi:MAG TPA: HD domain-containing phosphohydrolase [Candidatus Sulfotelmatobacter sp.]|nr:HD domain-containing phosphohydrolase [Candidatus Sulfotelmatobacter sp.]
MSAHRTTAIRAFIAVVCFAAAICLFIGFHHWQSGDSVRFAAYLLAALFASSLKVIVPGVEGTLSVNFLFTLLGVLELGLPQTLIIGLASTLAQFYWRAKRPKAVQLVFNLSQVTVSSAAAYGAYQLVVAKVLHGPGNLALLAAAITHFACNSAAMSTIIGLTEQKPIRKVWNDSYLWSFPYYMVGAATAGLIHFLNAHIGWQSSLLVLPPIYLMYHSYRLYVGKLETEKQHAEQVSKLHLRTIEALAAAIEAKDETTGEHLQRVRVYSMELAKELGLTEDETEALQAASVLHDIGKLAVPEHIISKPGKLTPEEFEKMKIHPVVGAEILERVNFPYPVAPIVRAHHEKWDGTGYPSGLAGEDIPIGARILAAVDCFDALASDRQYRKALPLPEAMAKVVADSGKSFDPSVVEILRRRYIELEKLATEQPLESAPKLSTDMKIERGSAPAAGFAKSEAPQIVTRSQNLDTAEIINAARSAREELLNLKQQCPTLEDEDFFSLLALRLKRLLPYDALAAYRLQNEVLVPAFVTGANSHLFLTLRIPLGEGLSGWVAQNHKPIVNGNPSVEPEYVNDPARFSTLRSALAVPLEGVSGVVAVLALYRAGQDAFTADDLRIVQTLSQSLGGSLDSAAAKVSGAKAGSV